MRILIWLQRDLRLHDHPAFSLAEEEGHEILSAFVMDQKELHPWEDGSPRYSKRKRQFLAQSLENLHYQLASFGVPLLYREGDTLEVLQELVSKHNIEEVWFIDTAGQEEAEQQAQINEHFRTRVFQAQTLVHPNDLPFDISYLPKVFTEFRKRIERFSQFRAPFQRPKRLKGIQTHESSQLPEIIDLEIDNRSSFPFKGGEEAALKRLYEWMWKGDHLKSYKETRNGLLGTDYSSKFSPWLAWGCLSPRYILQEIKRYEIERVTNRSTYWLFFELLWRDFFLFSWRNERNAFFKMPLHFNESPNQAFSDWKNGETGQKFIDANMLELKATGYMSNRGRQNVASYLVHHLKENWIHGARWFECQLIDYEVCNNYGNWTYVAGVGHDPRENRVFNPKIQSERYDPESRYINTWNIENQ